MRFKTSSVASLVILLAVSVAQSSSVVPQFVVGGGYEFIIIAANRSSSSQTIEFELLEGYDRPWSAWFSVNGVPQADNTVTVTLAGHSVKKLRIIGGSSPHAGYLRITEDSSTKGFASPAAIHFFYEFRQGREVIDSVGAPEGLTTFGSNALAFPVERSQTVNTGFALAPWSLPGLSSDHFSYTLRLFDQNGREVGIETFSFGGHLAVFFDEVFQGVPEEFLGWISLEVEGGMFDHLCVTVLRQELTSNGFQLTNVPPDFELSPQFLWADRRF